MKILLPLGFSLLLAPALLQDSKQGSLRIISTRVWHLGNDATPEWTEAPSEPEGGGMQVSFEGRAFEGEGVLFVRQRDVNNVWHIELNGTRIGQLSNGDSALNEHHYIIPEGLMRDGDNRLALVGETPSDDILFGDLRYAEKSLREWYGLRRTRLSVSQVLDGHRLPLPARITITDTEGQLVDLYYGESDDSALRKGLVYVAGKAANVELPPGDYHVYASRGMEWSRAKRDLHIAHDSHPDAQYGVELELRREVLTPGFIAADTHVHTLTHSGHGDATVEERQITLAGEGVELAIATDHNHNVDYAPTQTRMGLSEYYTTVVGNEVTTPIGHFNAFPLKPEDSIPPHESRYLGELLAGMRERGARVVILNHPRWPEGAKSPFATIGYDQRTGAWSGDWGSGYDAMELVNSDTEEKDPLSLFRDWFGLMNRGEAVVAVGASDSHAVGVVVGQGRTYVESSIDDPAQLDVAECSDNIAKGHSSVSMGIFANLVDAGGESMMGDQLQASLEQRLPEGLRLRIAAPSWVHPRRALIFINGSLVNEYLFPISPNEGRTPFSKEFPLGPMPKLPAHDYWMVVVVLGEGVDEPFWPLLNDYTLASTNPVFVDVDGDGAFSCARSIAEKLVVEQGTGERPVLEMLAGVDAAVGAQLMRLVCLDYSLQSRERAAALERQALEQMPALEGWIGGER